MNDGVGGERLEGPASSVCPSRQGPQSHHLWVPKAETPVLASSQRRGHRTADGPEGADRVPQRAVLRASIPALQIQTPPG